MGPNSTIIGSSNLPNEEHILHCHYLNGLCYARYDSDPLAPLQVINIITSKEKVKILNYLTFCLDLCSFIFGYCACNQ